MKKIEPGARVRVANPDLGDLENAELHGAVGTVLERSLVVELWRVDIDGSRLDYHLFRDDELELL